MKEQTLGMAKSRQDYVFLLSSLNNQVRQHTLKCLLMPDGGFTKGWCKEIAGWLSTPYDLVLKSTGKPMPATDVAEHLLNYRSWVIISSDLQNKLDDYCPKFVKTLNDYRYLSLALEPGLMKAFAFYEHSCLYQATGKLLRQELFEWFTNPKNKLDLSNFKL